MPRPYKHNSTLRQARIARGFTLVQISKLLGINYTTLSAYEAGTSVPSSDVFKKLKLILNLNGNYEDFFSHTKGTGRKKYYPGDVCSQKGCERVPAAKGLCMTHYVNRWRKKKTDQQGKMLHAAWEELAKSQKEKA